MPAALSIAVVLSRINTVSGAMNLLKGDDAAAVRSALELAVDTAQELLSASFAIILPYDEQNISLDSDGLVASRAARAPGFQLSPEMLELAGEALRSLSAVEMGEPAEDSQQLPSTPAVAVPLAAAAVELGVMIACGLPRGSLDDEQTALLDHLASLAARILAIARQSAQAQAEQARREKELRRLRRAGLLISSRPSLKDTLDAILKMALEFTRASYGIFRLVDPDGKSLVMRSFAGTVQARPAVEALPINLGSVMGYVALQREPVVIADLREDPWKAVYYPFDYDLEMRSEIAVPLIGASGRLEGVLNLESPEVNAFDREDRYLLQILATQAVVAIEGIRLVDALLEISAMLATSTQQQIHQALVGQACDLLNLPTSAIWMVEKDQLAVQAASEAGLAGYREPLGSSAVGQAVLTGRPVMLLETAAHPPVREVDPNTTPNPRSALVMPLFTSADPQPVGAFSVYTGPGDQRDFAQADWDQKVLGILCHYAALAVQNTARMEALRLAEDHRAATETFAAMGEIAANLLHRLNNKVGTIPVRVEGIQDKSAARLQADPYLADNLAEIQRSAAEAMRVVHESLDQLRPIQLKPVSILTSVQEALAVVRLPASVQVECSGLEGLPAVQAGANRLVMVFTNLLENASAAMESQGTIRIAGALHGPWVEVTVSDTGPGIPADLQEKIFEFSYSSRASTHSGNLGFGLWWVKSLMARFGGKVTVESGGTGGTTFTLSFPHAAEER